MSHMHISSGETEELRSKNVRLLFFLNVRLLITRSHHIAS